MHWLTGSPRRLRVLLPLGVVVLAVGTMLVGIATPDRIFFDEVYYVNDARDFLEFGVEQGFVVHPPLGKLLIATGIHVFGDNPLGWRVVGAVLATATTWLTWLLARRLGMRLGAATLAGLALVLDGVFIAQARTAMLDIHLAFFIVLGAWALVRDRDHVRRADDVALQAAADRAAAAASERAEAERAGARRSEAERAEAERAGAEDPTGHGSVATALAVGAPMHETPDRSAAGITDPGVTAPPGSDPAAGPEPSPPASAMGEVDAGIGQDGGPASAGQAAQAAPPAVHHDRAVDLPRTSRWWLVLAGAAFGAAVAVKWSGALAMLAAGLVWLGFELARRRRVTGRMTRRLPRAVVLGVLALGVVPLTVYLLTWIPWIVAFDNTYTATTHCAPAGDDLDCDGVVGRGRALVDHHDRMIQFHLGLEADHSYRAEAWNWPIQRRPVVFYYETCSQDRLERVPETDSDGEVTTPEPCRVQPGQAAEIFDLGNPASWWLLLAGLPILGLLLRRRDGNAWIVAAFYGAQFLPWLLASRPVFNFYTVPLVPFVVLGLAMAVDRISSRDAWVSALGAGAALAAVTLLASFGLDWAGVPISEVGRWYSVGVAALLGGALSPAIPGTATGPAPHRDRHTWPTITVIAAVVLVGLFFLPTWTGITTPEWFVKAHWWLPTWI